MPSTCDDASWAVEWTNAGEASVSNLSDNLLGWTEIWVMIISVSEITLIIAI